VSHDTTQTIADLRVGQKVITDAPWQALAADRESQVERESGEAHKAAVTLPPDERVDPATWKLVRLRAELRWDDGTLDDVNVETLQAPEWLLANGVRVGGQVPIPLDLVEMGLPGNLQAAVLAIEPCPAIASGPGRIVLTTVNHLNADVYELTIRDSHGRQETIRTTGGHKFYSATRNAWISAAQLQPREQLYGLAGPLHVVSLKRLPGAQRVYNMSVQGEHVYRVSCLAALVHNQNCLQLGGHGPMQEDVALEQGLRWLGKGYREIGPGVYRSADGLRQFRITDADLIPTHGSIGPHVHFEAFDSLGIPLENLHIPVVP
jgi:hypothetical protein